MGVSGAFDIQFLPQGGETDYWLGQIPTFTGTCDLHVRLLHIKSKQLGIVQADYKLYMCFILTLT